MAKTLITYTGFEYWKSITSYKEGLRWKKIPPVRKRKWIKISIGPVERKFEKKILSKKDKSKGLFIWSFGSLRFGDDAVQCLLSEIAGLTNA